MAKTTYLSFVHPWSNLKPPGANMKYATRVMLVGNLYENFGV